jgi:CRISPR-associated endonuclease/helicase Cas3
MAFNPYPYQDKVLQALLAGKNVILQAPTGAGKTIAALRPILRRFDEYDQRREDGQHHLPLSCRYAVPMRVLATQFNAEWVRYLEKMKQGGALFLDPYHALNIRVPAIQTGESPEDPQFESPLTFCTIDQLLASFIGTPYSLSHGRANVNVGAVAGSYLILDEFHLYPFEKDGSGARLTTLAMLRMLKNFSPFCLMTATFSTKLLCELATLLDAEVIQVQIERDPEKPDEPSELETIMKGRARTIRTAGEPLNAASIIAAHEQAIARKMGASLVVCNTVARAQDIYVKVRDILYQRGIDSEIHLLHSRFTPKARDDKSKLLHTLMGEEQWENGHFIGKSVIVIATQVVEVGLNISSGVLHTDVAPANSIIQRAGRNARFEMQQGEVIVYPIPLNDKGKSSYLPYDEALCKDTYAELERLVTANDGLPVPFGFREEQALIDQVHTKEDERMLQIFRANRVDLESTIFNNLATHEHGNEDALIRDVRQVQVVIHDTPNETIMIHPFAWQSFGLHPGTLKGAWDALNKRGSALGLDWVMRQAIAVSQEESAEDDSARVMTYTWDKVTNTSQIAGALRIALPSALARYDDEIGFQLLLDDSVASNGWQSQELPKAQRRDTEDENGQQGSYVGHITGLIRAYDDSGIRAHLAWLACRLEQELQLPSGIVDFATRLAIGCHDIGKLSQGWQTWAYTWQGILMREYGAASYAIKEVNRWLAKTDRRSWREEQELKQRYPETKKRPHHACEGAIASAQAVGQTILARFDSVPEDVRPVGYLAQAVVNAIARHHGPLSNSYQTVAWDPGAREAIADAFRACRLDVDPSLLDLSQKSEGTLDPNLYLFTPTLVDGMSRTATWLAFAIVRALRLCDQRAERM